MFCRRKALAALFAVAVQGVEDDGVGFGGGANLVHFNGFTFEPKIVAKLGPGRSSNDLLNVDATIGYVRAF